ncbi:hypothetical protein, partial [Amycolatopsis kentuckyensis]|uniref:hypothetical protein n=1 Tax=Amycolatopsis kentuckyensis TaxID=218823 RepID=UPI001ABFE373
MNPSALFSAAVPAATTTFLVVTIYYFVARTRSRDSDLQSQVGIELREQAASKVSEAKENAERWTSERISATEERQPPVPDEFGEAPGAPGT